MPVLFEPDFSPNPPLMSIAEWQIARLSGNLLRMRNVYPVLKANHQWIYHNRRLPDGTYWTTGLANGLDNSPSLGDGYPDLSAQMAHEAEVLSKIAKLIGNDEDATAFECEQRVDMGFESRASVGGELRATLCLKVAAFSAADYSILSHFSDGVALTVGSPPSFDFKLCFSR